MSILNRSKVSTEDRLEMIEKHLHAVEGDVAWIKEYFTPDEDGSDRFTRLEGRMGGLEGKMDQILEKLNA